MLQQIQQNYLTILYFLAWALALGETFVLIYKLWILACASFGTIKVTDGPIKIDGLHIVLASVCWAYLIMFWFN